MEEVKINQKKKRISPAEHMKKNMNKGKDKPSTTRVNFMLEDDVITTVETLANEKYDGNISLTYRKIIKEYLINEKEI